MGLVELYRRRAQDCARLRNLANTEMARRRLDRECADWLRLAHAGAEGGRRRQTAAQPLPIDDGARP